MRKINSLLIMLTLLPMLLACGNGDKTEQKNTTETDNRIECSYLFENDTLVWAYCENDELYMRCNKEVVTRNKILFEEQYRLPDEAVRVTGLRGSAKALHISDIGQDYNPILCVLNENGEVGIMQVYEAILTGNPSLGYLDLSDITGFEDGYNREESEDDDIIFEYATIYAKSKTGESHEIPLYLGPRFLLATTPNAEYHLVLNANWNMTLSYDKIDGQTVKYQGRFSPINKDCVTDSECSFTYDMSDGTTNINGEFRLDSKGDGVGVWVTATSGDFGFGADEIGNMIEYIVQGDIFNQ